MNWNPAEQFAQDAERLPIDAPPCANCNNWRPARQYDCKGQFIGVRLCQADEMHIDFSCFRSRDDTPKPKAMP